MIIKMVGQDTEQTNNPNQQNNFPKKIILKNLINTILKLQTNK